MDNGTKNSAVGWKNAPHVMCDIAGTIASSYMSGNFDALRSIPPEGYKAFCDWLRRVL